MTKSSSRFTLSFTFCATLLFQPFTMTAQAADQQDVESFDIDTISCWDLGDAEPGDRVTILMLVYGYVAGASNNPTHTGESIKSALENSGKLCSANPDMYVSEAMERVL